MSDAVREKIRTFVFTRFPLAKDRGLGDGASLLDSGVIDSLGILDLVGFMEESFSIAVADEELEPANFDSVDALVRFIALKQT